MLSSHLVRIQPSLDLEESCPGTSRQGDQIREPATPTRTAYLRPKSVSITVYYTKMKPRSDHQGSLPGPAYYRVFCRQQEQDAAGQG